MEQIANIAANALGVTAILAFYFCVIKPNQDEKAKQKSKKAGAADPMHHCTGCDKCRGRKEVYNRLETLEDFQ